MRTEGAPKAEDEMSLSTSDRNLSENHVVAVLETAAIASLPAEPHSTFRASIGKFLKTLPNFVTKRLIAMGTLGLLAWTTSAQAQGAAATSGPQEQNLQRQQPANNERFAFEFRHPETQELIRVYIPTLPSQELRQWSPRNLRRRVDEQFRQQQNAQRQERDRFANRARHFATDIPAELVAFNLALALNARNHMENDPIALKNFIDRSILDPVAHVSFIGFLAASRASTSFLQSAGLAYDPLRAPIGDNRINVPQRMQMVAPGLAIPQAAPWAAQVQAVPAGPTRLQRGFAPLVGPMGLVAGMTVSSVITEMANDPDLQTCSKSLVSRSVKPEDAETACEKAYENWAISKKLMDYAPDLFSMVATSFIQAYLVNYPTMRAAGLVGRVVSSGAERYLPVVFRGLNITWRLGSFMGGPWARFAITVANVFVFMEINHMILPYLKNPWERRRQGQDITDSLNVIMDEIGRAEAQAWRWRPAAEIDPDCTQPNSLQADAHLDMFMAGGIPLPAQCYRSMSPQKLLEKHAEKTKKWRNFALQDAYSAHTNWQKKVADFSTMYANAYSFYRDMADNIHWQRTTPNIRPQDRSPLYVASPLHGLFVDPQQRTDSQGARDALNRARSWLRDYLQRLGTSARERSLRVPLTSILRNLDAVDPAVPATQFLPPPQSAASYMALPEAQRNELGLRLREEAIRQALTQIRTTLQNDRALSDRHIPYPSPLYESLAEHNPYMKLRLLMGDPEPLREGLAYLRAFNDDPAVIAQETKRDHPSGIGRARAQSMVDYLLISMVCGPTADPNAEERIRLFQSSRRTTMDSVLHRFGLSTPPSIDPNNREAMIEVDRHFESTMRPTQDGQLPGRGPHNLITGPFGFAAQFRPPQVVQPINYDICNTFPRGHNRDLPTFDIHNSQFVVEGKTYHGFLELVRDRMRSEIVGTTPRPAQADPNWTSAFDTWWERHVDVHVQSMLNTFRQQFHRVLREKYLPALTNTERRQYNGREFALGALPSLEDEARFYTVVLAKTANVSQSGETRQEYGRLAEAYLQQLRALGRFVGDTSIIDAKQIEARQRYDELKGRVQQAQDALTAFVGARVASDAPQAAVQTQVLRNLKSCTDEMDSYFGIVRSIQVPGL